MLALVADSNPASRLTTKRILIRDLGAKVVEADTGVDAIEQLSKHPCAFAVLEIDLPVIHGIRVLEILREAPDDASIPVVMLGTAPDESAVRRMLELGINEMIVRPIDPSALSRRFVRFAQRGGLTATRAGAGSEATEVEYGAKLLIADGDADFRHFAASALRGKMSIMQASTGTEALKLAIAKPPSIALIGRDLGILKSNLLVREIRLLPNLRRTKIVAVAPRTLVDTVMSTAEYDGVLTRTFVTSLFLEQFDHLISPEKASSQLTAAHPSLEGNLTTAVEQVCGMMLGVEVAPVTNRSVEKLDRAVVATVRITIKGAAPLTFQLRCSMNTARQLSAQMLGQDADATSEDDMVATLGEMANVVSGRLRTGWSERGTTCQCDFPEVSVVSETPNTPAPDGLTLTFASADGGVSLDAAIYPATVSEG